MTELPDRLLRDALHDAASPMLSPMCVDADRLAIWADGTMTGTDRAALEAHAAGCARCLALLAAMTRIEPARIEMAWWRRARFAWVLPLATATAALVIVAGLAVIERRTPVPAAVGPSDAAARRAVPTTVQAAPPADSPPEAAGVPAQPAQAAAPAPRRLERSANAAATSSTQSEMRLKPEAVAPAAASPAPPTAAEAAKDTAPPPAPAMAPAPMPAPAAPASALRDETARPAGAGAFAAQSVMKEAASLPVVIPSPDRDSQWRIVGGAVEHTADGGVTWQPQPIGIATPVRAGAAPAARVCWLAGMAGVVLRTTDGATWIRIAFPEPADLVAIQAADASHARVVTATGLRFSTSDGGTTWTRQ
jgi:hypothetical protein